MVHPSAYCRSGLDPMKAQHSIGMPVRCEIRAIGTMSAITVRAAQFALTDSRADEISRASRSTSRTTCSPAPGRPMFAVSMPRRSMRCRIRTFCSIVGQRTDGDCRPSRSVSSSSITGRGVCSDARFQSWMRGCIVNRQPRGNPHESGPDRRHPGGMANRRIHHVADGKCAARDPLPRVPRRAGNP